MAADYNIDLDALLTPHGGDPLGRTPMIGYIRVSTAREDMISPEIQVDHIDRDARTTGRRIVAWVADLDLSGRTLDKRQINAIIDSIADGTAPDGAREIGVWKYSRFGRNRADNAYNLARLEKAGGSLRSATEQVDATTSIGRFTRGMMMELAAFESDRLAEGWADVQAYRRKAGLPNSGRERFGYVRLGRIRVGPEHWIDDPNDPKGERYEPSDERHAAELRRMYEDAAAGRSGYSILRWLNQNRVPSPSGAVGKWTHTTLWPLLDSGFGCGYIRQHDPECTVHDRNKAGWCQNRVWLPGAHDHLWAHLPDGDATRDRIWAAYRARRAASRKTPPRAVEAQHELTSAVICEWCEGTMAAHRNNPGSAAYSWVCNGKTRGTCEHTNSASDRMLRAAVRDLLTREHHRLAEIEAATDLHDPAPDTTPDIAGQLADAEAAHAAVKRKLDRLADQHITADIPPETFRRLRDRYLSEQAEIEATLAELRAAQSEEEDRPDYVAVTRGLVAEWDTLPTWSVNKILRELVEITVKRTSRVEAWATIRTAWGTEERVPVAERMGRPSGKPAG